MGTVQRREGDTLPWQPCYYCNPDMFHGEQQAQVTHNLYR